MRIKGIPRIGRLAGLPTDRCAVMGVLNVSPDSFSDGRVYRVPGEAAQRGLELWREGADIVDVGGESTRPGAQRVSESVELDRVVPVVQKLARAGVAVSIDTMRATVAAEAVAAGAALVNDVSGGLADPAMAGLMARQGLPYIVSHWRGPSDDMYARATYVDVIADVRRELDDRVHALVRAGMSLDQLVLDPGIGFSKTAHDSWRLLGGLSELAELGLPILVGMSRKSLLCEVDAGNVGLMTMADRDSATVAMTGMIAGAVSCVRVHEVRQNAMAVRVAARMNAAASDSAVRARS
jgi:dihydropteroate synthase